MDILLALIFGAAYGGVLHFLMPGRTSRGAALAPMIGGPMYFVLSDYGPRVGKAYHEADPDAADRETVLSLIVRGNYSRIVGVLEVDLLAAGLLEEMIAWGCRKFIACGGCGVLAQEIAVGHLILVTSAVRDEGVSYHYLPPAREVYLLQRTKGAQGAWMLSAVRIRLPS